MSVSLISKLEVFVKRLTDGYGESHNHVHAEKVARNATQIFSLTKEKIPQDLQEKGW